MNDVNEQNPEAPTAEQEGHQPERGIRTQLIENVNVRVEAYLGGTRISIGDLAALGEGAVLPLDAPLNQSVELRLNGVPIAKGELVAVGDNFAVRLSEISK